MNVLIPSPLVSYTKRKVVEAVGATLGEMLLDLEKQFPGIRFRMVNEQDKVRPHMRIFVNGEQEFSLTRPLTLSDEISIVQALSGG